MEPHRKLMWAIVLDGIASRDRPYLRSHRFVRHCEILGVPVDQMRRVDRDKARQGLWLINHAGELA